MAEEKMDEEKYEFFEKLMKYYEFLVFFLQDSISNYFTNFFSKTVF